MVQCKGLIARNTHVKLYESFSSFDQEAMAKV